MNHKTNTKFVHSCVSFLIEGVKTRLISIVSKPIKLICGQTNFDEEIVKKIWVKKILGQKNLTQSL